MLQTFYVYIVCLAWRWGNQAEADAVVGLSWSMSCSDELFGVNMEPVNQYLFFWEPACFKYKYQKSAGVASALQATKYRNLIGTGNTCDLALNHARKNVYDCFYW